MRAWLATSTYNLERYRGKYVAIDLATDEVVLTAETPYQLHEEIQGPRASQRGDHSRRLGRGGPFFMGLN